MGCGRSEDVFSCGDTYTMIYEMLFKALYMFLLLSCIGCVMFLFILMWRDREVSANVWGFIGLLSMGWSALMVLWIVWEVVKWMF